MFVLTIVKTFNTLGLAMAITVSVFISFLLLIYCQIVIAMSQMSRDGDPTQKWGGVYKWNVYTIEEPEPFTGQCMQDQGNTDCLLIPFGP